MLALSIIIMILIMGALNAGLYIKKSWVKNLCIISLFLLAYAMTFVAIPRAKKEAYVSAIKGNNPYKQTVVYHDSIPADTIYVKIIN